MAKHNRNQTRKSQQREQRAAEKNAAKYSRKKSTTPESLCNRFAHILKNQSDIDAIRNYGTSFEQGYSKANGPTAAQLSRILSEQIEQLESCSAESLKLLCNRLKRLKNKEVRR